MATDPALQGLGDFFLLALLMAATPGPNMVCLLGCTAALGPSAGYVTLAGMAAAFGLHALVAECGFTVALTAGSHGLTVLRWGAVLCLLWLSWQSLSQGMTLESRSQVRDGTRTVSAGRLFATGFMVNALNPLVVVFFLTVLPQFAVHSGIGTGFGSVLALGIAYAAVSVSCNFAVTLGASRVFGWMRRCPGHIIWMRRTSAFVLAAFAMKLVGQAPG